MSKVLDLIEYLEQTSGPGFDYDSPEPDYSTWPDAVIALPKADYERYAAYREFATLSEGANLVLYRYRETETHYVWECINDISV